MFLFSPIFVCCPPRETKTRRNGRDKIKRSKGLGAFFLHMVGLRCRYDHLFRICVCGHPSAHSDQGYCTARRSHAEIVPRTRFQKTELPSFSSLKNLLASTKIMPASGTLSTRRASRQTWRTRKDDRLTLDFLYCPCLPMCTRSKAP